MKPEVGLVLRKLQPAAIWRHFMSVVGRIFLTDMCSCHCHSARYGPGATGCDVCIAYTTFCNASVTKSGWSCSIGWSLRGSTSCTVFDDMSPASFSSSILLAAISPLRPPGPVAVRHDQGHVVERRYRQRPTRCNAFIVVGRQSCNLRTGHAGSTFRRRSRSFGGCVAKAPGPRHRCPPGSSLPRHGDSYSTSRNGTARQHPRARWCARNLEQVRERRYVAGDYALGTVTLSANRQDRSAGRAVSWHGTTDARPANAAANPPEQAPHSLRRACCRAGDVQRGTAGRVATTLIIALHKRA